MALDPGMQSMQMDPSAMQGGMQGGAMGELPQAQPGTQGPPQELQQQDTGDYDAPDPMEAVVDFALSQANLAKHLKEEDLDAMGQVIYQGYQDDETSRKKWMEANEEWMKLALLTRENKTWPWPRAANVKYPLIATAAMQFSARAYPALVPSDGNIVKAKVSAVDKQGLLEQQAIRVGKHMSYQIQCSMPNWEEDMDKLLMTIAVSGICFKKTYYNALLQQICSHIVYPEHLVINYWAKSIEKAYRKTEILFYTDNEVKEKVANDEEFLDIEYAKPEISQTMDPKVPIVVADSPVKVDSSTPHVFLSCHTFWDLDGDGYEEPYIITIHQASKKVVRIIARWDSDGVHKDDKGKIVKIVPVEYFTDFPFIPNPDGSIYTLGFGMLLGPLNEAVNTLVNQLVDAGTLSNLQSGFVGRNLRIKEGQVQLRPGEWKVVNASGEDMQKSIVALPAKEPSNVLMSLLQMLITSGNQLASIAEIFVGKMPGQNTTATTTQETIQQGMAVFTAIYKRVYRSLSKEFKKIFRINRITPGIVEDESRIVGQLQQSDYEGTEHLIIPGADPTGDSATVRMQKLQQVGQLIQMGTINPMAFTQRMLEGLEIPNYQELIAQPQPPQPDPTEQAKQQTEQLKQQGLQQKYELDAKAKQQEMAMKERQAALDDHAKRALLDAQEKKLQVDVAKQTMDAVHERQMAAIEHGATAAEKKQDLVYSQMKHQQDLEHGQQKIQHEDAMAQKQMAREESIHNQQMEMDRKAANTKIAIQKQTAKAKPKKK